MNLSDLFGLLFAGAFAGLILGFTAALRRRPWRPQRPIAAFARLRRAVGFAVEAGQRLHLSLGRGILIGEHGPIAFVGLSMLERIASLTSISDNPPVATSGEAGIAILSQDTLHTAARSRGAEFEPSRAQLTGLTPFSYAAGALVSTMGQEVGTNMLIGSLGVEAALLTEAGEDAGSLTLAGTDRLSGQAVIYASADEPLIGEETFAGGAYLGAGPTHTASLWAQDVLRWVIILVIVIGALLKLAGFV
jgi:hypothetical protein